MPRTLRAHRPGHAGHPRRVHQGHQDAPGVDLLQMRQADALRGADQGPHGQHGEDGGVRRGHRRVQELLQGDRQGRVRQGHLPLLRRRADQDQARQAHHLQGGQRQPQADRQGGPREARAHPRRRPQGPGHRPRDLQARVDGPHSPGGPAGHREALHHPRLRRQVRGRPDPQAGRRPEDQPEAQGEPRRRCAAADRRGPVGAAPVSRHHLLRQPDLRYPAREA